MNIDILRSILIEKNLYIKENSKNIISICFLCGDHPDDRKKGHLWISKDIDKPVGHCFLCNDSLTIYDLVLKLTGDVQLSNNVITKEQIERSKKYAKIKNKNELSVYKIPEIDEEKFKNKISYLKIRSNHKLHYTKIPNLIFDFKEFININGLSNLYDDVFNSPYLLKKFQSSYVGILSRHHTLLWCRNIDPNSIYKFRKIELQKDELKLLDYIYLKGDDPYSNNVILAEGPFDIIGEYALNSLNLRNTSCIYAAGLSFSYKKLLTSVCFDETLFNTNVYILSDSDKKPYYYYKFKKQKSHLINEFNLFYNKHKGGDFGSFPIKPFKYEI